MHIFSSGFFRLLLLSLLSVFLFIKTNAQDYQFVQPGHSFHYNNSISPYPNFFNIYTWSQIKETRIDSSSFSGTDTLYFPFRTWRDTLSDFSVSQGIDTGILYGPSWMGERIKESITSGMTVFYNETGDSMIFDRQATAGQSWVIMQLDTSGRIEASVDSVSFDTLLAGSSDSIKYIHLNVYDTMNVQISSHPANNFNIRLSRFGGWPLIFSIREFPQEVIPLTMIEDPGNPTEFDIYNFDIGDEFEYFSNYNNSVSTYSYIKILDKYFNSTSDSVNYMRYTIVNSGSASGFYASSDTDTISYPARMNLFYSNVPEQTSTPLHGHGTYFNCYTISKNPVFYNNRTVFRETDGYCFIDTSSSTIGFIHFEAELYTSNFSAGLGMVYNSSDQSSMFNHWYTELKWYRKGLETWGTFNNLITALDQINGSEEIKLFPNPAGNFIIISMPENYFSTVNVFSMDGSYIKSEAMSGSSFKLSLEDIPPGMLLLSLEGKTGAVKKRIVHIQE